MYKTEFHSYSTTSKLNLHCFLMQVTFNTKINKNQNKKSKLRVYTHTNKQLRTILKKGAETKSKNKTKKKKYN